MKNNDVEELLRIVRRIIDRETADGCIGCAYLEQEEWEAPCNKCRRAAKDYWRMPQK